MKTAFSSTAIAIALLTSLSAGAAERGTSDFVAKYPAETTASASQDYIDGKKFVAETRSGGLSREIGQISSDSGYTQSFDPASRHHMTAGISDAPGLSVPATLSR